MKYIAFILALYTLVLTALPCCAIDNCKDEPKTETSNETEKEGSCSPFFVCSSCSGFVNNETPVSFLESMMLFSEMSSQDYPEYAQTFYSKICLNIWQPPKVG